MREVFLMRIEIFLLCGAVLLSGCISSSGERTVQEEPAARTTGQQLQDLKADYDKGRISEQESISEETGC
jgi:PBP1b-binding outer membrane lipoprotein LpoB